MSVVCKIVKIELMVWNVSHVLYVVSEKCAGEKMNINVSFLFVLWWSTSMSRLTCQHKYWLFFNSMLTLFIPLFFLEQQINKLWFVLRVYFNNVWIKALLFKEPHQIYIETNKIKKNCTKKTKIKIINMMIKNNCKMFSDKHFLRVMCFCDRYERCPKLECFCWY